MANGPSGRGRGILEKVWTRQEHGPKWSVTNVRTDMVRNSEHWAKESARNPYCVSELKEPAFIMQSFFYEWGLSYQLTDDRNVNYS